MGYCSDTPRSSRPAVLGASLALVLVGASLALALAVRGAGGPDPTPAAPAASSDPPVTRSASSPSWLTTSSTTTASTTIPAAAQSPAAAALSLEGVPAAEVNYGSPYSFTPTVSAPAGTALAFSIQNKPAWAAFDSSNGALTGTPGLADVGTDANIVISVSGGTSSTSLAAFTISVNEVSNGAATLDWSGVTQTLADTTLGDLAGYVVYYGTSADNLNQHVKLANPGLTTYVVTNLASGTWYFGIAGYTKNGVEGVVSSVVQKTIP